MAEFISFVLQLRFEESANQRLYFRWLSHRFHPLWVILSKSISTEPPPNFEEIVVALFPLQFIFLQSIFSSGRVSNHLFQTYKYKNLFHDVPLFHIQSIFSNGFISGGPVYSFIHLESSLSILFDIKTPPNFSVKQLYMISQTFYFGRLSCL